MKIRHLPLPCNKREPPEKRSYSEIKPQDTNNKAMKINIGIFVFLFGIFSFAHGADKIELSGFYEYRTDLESLDYLGDLICFFPNSETSHRIAQNEKTNRLTWFCFVSNKEARKILLVPEKTIGKCGYTAKADIIISGYKDLGGYQPDKAKLEEVLSLGVRKEIPCK